MKKTDLRIIKTKEALRTALLTLLQNKSLEQISISELCREAKVNRGTFYLHYVNVEALFAQYFREITEDLNSAYMEPYRFYKEIDLAKLNPEMIRIFYHIEKYKTFYSIIFSPNVPLQYYYLLFDTIKALMSRNASIENIEMNSIKAQLYISYHANAIIGLIMQWCVDGFMLTVEEMNTQLVNIIGYGQH